MSMHLLLALIGFSILFLIYKIQTLYGGFFNSFTSLGTNTFLSCSYSKNMFFLDDNSLEDKAQGNQLRIFV